MNESTRKSIETRKLLGPRLRKIPFDKPQSPTLEPRKFTRRGPSGRGPVR